MAGTPQFVATVAANSDTKPGTGIEGTNALLPAGPGFVMATATKVACEYLPVAKVGDLVSPHGNYFDPKKPGFNPLCKNAYIVEGSPTVMVEGKPMALAGPMGSLLSCGHWLTTPRTKKTIVAGL
jgi:uncharacterized Zn-binding protein involved in type VI secretion